jgi:hypothetical protein
MEAVRKPGAARRLLPVVALLAAADAGAQGAAVRDLLTAARKGDEATVRRALATGVDVDATDPSFLQTALIRAAMFGQVEAAKALLAAGADAEHRAAPDGMRALHWAARQGSAEIVKALVAAGADVDAPDGNDTTPLEYGIEAGSPAAVQALIAAGADPAKMRQPISRRIGTALNADVPGPEVEALIASIRAGRDLERASGLPGEGTALLALAGRANRPGAERVAEALVAAGANLRATDEKGRTARQIVEAWIPSQRVASFRKTLEAVAAVLRKAEGR